MKTSNYIIIAFFVFLITCTFVLFLDAKMNFKNRQVGLQEKRLEPFSVVVAEDGAEFNIRNGEYPRMTCYYDKPDTCTFPEYGIRNDTLFVFACKEKKKPNKWHEIHGRNIKSIVAKVNSIVKLQQFTADSLDVKLDYAIFEAYFDQTKGPKAQLSITASTSKINMSGAHLENLNVRLNKTKMNSWNNSIVHLSGSLANKSELSIGAIQKISLEVDSTSAYQLQK
ncbi:MAG: hypothetical protein JZU47_08415 [Prolixibacteraceae bacterium]|nr:hypothetical protein [Prolixibacteraceae bacterium]